MATIIPVIVVLLAGRGIEFIGIYTAFCIVAVVTASLSCHIFINGTKEVLYHAMILEHGRGRG